MPSRSPRRHVVRPTAGKALAAALAVVLAAALALVPLGAASRAEAADGTEFLNVAFGGNFNVGNTYTSATGETMGGQLVRRDGAEHLVAGTGIVLGGGAQGLTFTPTGVGLGTGTVDQGFVMETTFTAASSQVALGTLLAVGGNLSARYQNGKLRYGFDSNKAGTWTSNIKEVDLPAPDVEHTLSIAYLPTESGTANGATMIAFLDQQQLPSVEVADGRAAIAGSVAGPVGFGGDVHPAALQRGFVGSLRAIRWATADGTFDPSMFALQQVSYVRTPLQVAFSGTVAAGQYSAGVGEKASGLTVTGGTIPQPGRLELAGPDSGVSWDATALGEDPLGAPLLAEVVVAPDALAGKHSLVDLLGAVRLDSAGDGAVTVVAGGVEQARALPAPTHASGLDFHHLSLHAELDAARSGSVTVLDGGTVLGDPIAVSGLAATTSAVTFLSGVTGTGYGIAVSSGGAADQGVLGALPCTASTLEPGQRFTITSGECAASVLSKASAVRPSQRQVQWQRAEQTAFLHFGMNTFTGNEWGDGTEDPNTFQPTALDTDQWAESLRDNGFRYAILTVKHHDGFLLYPSRYTDHDVASSSWDGGNGDVLASFTASAHRYGLKVGIYLSPADWSQYHQGVFANGSAKSARTIPTLVPGDDRAGKGLPSYSYQATDYGAYFLNQLYETLTQYGEVDEVWFDGADGGIPGAAAEEYDFAAWYDLIRKLQPQATIAVSGPDVRWVGNESGLARENESSVVAVRAGDNGGQGTVPGGTAADLGSDAALAAAANSGAQALTWWPAEVDVSIRQGWFYHPDQAPKTVDALRTIYYQSVGRNSVLLLNIPPGTNGRLPAGDVARLGEWNAKLRQDMPADLLLGRPATGPDGAAAGAATDGDLQTSWVSDAGTGEVTADLGAVTPVDRVVLGEDIAAGGQQVTAFAVDARAADGSWQQVAASGTIGYRKSLALSAPVDTAALRLRITAARGPVRLAGFSAFRSTHDTVSQQHIFYVDCSAATAGDGSRRRPMNSLGQLRAVNLPAGAQVLLRAGTTCAGPLELWGYGTDGAPAVLAGYGSGAAPVIDDPALPATLDTLRAQGWQIDLDTVEPAATSTALTASAADQTYGSAPTVLLTATVESADGAHPAGTVTFRSGSTVIAASSVDADGDANFRLPATTPAGRSLLTAAFTPDDPAVTAPSVSDPVSVRVLMALSSVTADATAAKSGKDRTIRLSVAVSSGSALPPVGTVSVNLNGSKVASVPVAGGSAPTATVRTSLPASKGTATLVVTFMPAEPSNVQRSTDTVTVTVR